MKTTGNSEPEDTSLRVVLARNIVALRKAAGWSQEALAHEAGLHRTFIAHCERGARNVSIDNVERIARALQIEPFRLLTPTAAAARS